MKPEEPEADVLTCSKVLLARARYYEGGRVLVPVECLLDLLEAVERADGARPPLPPEFMSAEQVACMVRGD